MNYLDCTDMARLATSVSEACQVYGHSIDYLAPIAPIVVAVAATFVLWRYHAQLATMATPFRKLGAWKVNRKRERDMRIVDAGQQTEYMTYGVVDLVEAQVAEGKWTRDQADVWYAKMSRALPKLNDAIASRPSLLEYAKEWYNKQKPDVSIEDLPARGGATTKIRAVLLRVRG